MNWAVDTPRRAGAIAFAAIVEVGTDVDMFGEAVVGRGQKRPSVVLMFDTNSVVAIEINGGAVATDEVERRFPKAVSIARRQLQDIE